jgi:tetratricopeptide (TPR) repeat protein
VTGESGSGWRVAGAGVVLLAGLLVAGCDLFGDPHQRGERYLKRGDYESAREALTEAIESGQEVAIAYANRCYANEAMGDYDAAVSDCDEALRLDREGGTGDGFPRWEVLNNRGVAKLGKADYEGALGDFDAAIQEQPDYAAAYANRGRAYLDQERQDDAIEALSRAIELDPELTEAYGNRGLAHEGLGENDQALADYTRAIELSHDPQAYFNRAMLRYTLGYFDDAYDDFNEVVAREEEGSYLAFMAAEQAEFLKNRPEGFDPDAQAESTVPPEPTEEPTEESPEEP